jgi:peptidoglycan/LPS O-acetylase OafA/YrhL
LQAGPTAVRPAYRLIQVLRAVAAVMVVAHHTTILMFARQFWTGNWVNGGGGVDIFFVISGFVMTISSAPLRQAPHPARTFLARRLERILPLYWALTTFKVLTVVVAPALAANALGGWWHVAASYLMLPSLDPGRGMDPVLLVGWTLNFEMAFYVLFAVALATRTALLKVLAPALLLAALLATLKVPAPGVTGFYLNTMVLEFLYGMVLATLLHRAVRVPEPLAWALALGGFYALCELPEVLFAYRGYTWGLAALCTVWGAVALERRWGPRAPRWLLELGDASYSIYLVHGFVLPLAGFALVRLATRAHATERVELGCIVAFATLCGEAVYRGLERPMMQWFKGRRKTAVPANA